MRSLVRSMCIALLLPGAVHAAVDTLTTCPSPQMLGPAVVVTGNVAYQPAVAWNGFDYGVLWIDYSSSTVRFQRLFADGSPAAPAVAVGSTTFTATGLVWNGTGYGGIWTGLVNGYAEIFFAKLDVNGNVVSGPTRISAVSQPSPTVNNYNAAIATSGNGYLVTFSRSNTDYDIYGTILDATGTVVYADFPITAATGSQDASAVVWSPSSGRYVVAWMDARSGVRYEIWASTVTPNAAISSASLIVSASGYSLYPSLVSTTSNIGLAWQDTRDGNYEAYFTILNPIGLKMGTDQRQTFDGNYTYEVKATWTGGEFGTLFNDNRTGAYDLWYQRTALNSTPVGNNLQETYYVGLSAFGAAFAAHGYLIAYTAGNGLLAQPLGCNYPYAPACPEAPDAYGISGTTATIAWLPVLDNYTDIAYYQVYRNAALVGTTSHTYWNDTGLSPSTTYQYNIRTVNAADQVSTGCTGSQIYVKSSAALALNVGKSATDVMLSWTDANGQNTYRVMRGTSPQSMVQIDSTTAQSDVDHNAVIGNVCYFYSIDVPQ